MLFGLSGAPCGAGPTSITCVSEVVAIGSASLRVLRLSGCRLASVAELADFSIGDTFGDPWWFSMEALELGPSPATTAPVTETGLEGPADEFSVGMTASPPSAGIDGRDSRILRRTPLTNSFSVSIVLLPIKYSTLGGTKSPKGFCGISLASPLGGRSRLALRSSSMDACNDSITWSSSKPKFLSSPFWKKARISSCCIFNIFSANTSLAQSN